MRCYEPCHYRNITALVGHHAGVGVCLFHEEGDTRPAAEDAVGVRQRRDGGGQRVVEELIPETAECTHTNLSTIGFSIGFVLMMVMDVVLG